MGNHETHCGHRIRKILIKNMIQSFSLYYTLLNFTGVASNLHISALLNALNYSYFELSKKSCISASNNAQMIDSMLWNDTQTKKNE